MGNSPLVNFTRLSPNHSGHRTQPISKITIHYVDGPATIETLGEIFASPQRRASSNYGIGLDGRIGMYVEECNRSWCSSSAWNDNQAITIECSNYEDGSLSDAGWNALIELVTDICKRNGIGECTYTGNPDGVLTMHCWYADTDCPGSWLKGRFHNIARAVNERLINMAANRLTHAEEAAEICEHFINHNAHGYSQINRDGDGTTETIRLTDGTSVSFSGGDRDCSRLMQTCYVVIGVLPRGMHMWTGNEIETLKANGFVQVPLNQVKRGDVLWRQGHTEMYLGNSMQGGARRSENHSIHGATGDQDGLEICRSAYNASEWTSAWRCTKVRLGEGESKPVQPKSEPRNDIGLNYRMHVQGYGWLPAVRDGQIAGTVGLGKRGEAIKITPPNGVHLDVTIHVQNEGDLTFEDVHKGKSSGTGSSSNDPIMGTTGKGLRLEAITITVTKLPANLKGMKLMYQAHIQGKGWTRAVKAGKRVGTVGKGLRLEAFRAWFE